MHLEAPVTHVGVVYSAFPVLQASCLQVRLQRVSCCGTRQHVRQWVLCANSCTANPQHTHIPQAMEAHPLLCRSTLDLVQHFVIPVTQVRQQLTHA